MEQARKIVHERLLLVQRMSHRREDGVGELVAEGVPWQCPAIVAQGDHLLHRAVRAHVVVVFPLIGWHGFHPDAVGEQFER